MQPKNFPGANIEYKKPETMSDEISCGSIHAFQGIDENKYAYILTHWEPSVEDLKALNAGRGLWVKLMVPHMPVISIVTVNENDKVNE